MKKHYHIISLTVLFVIGFLFVHSELDLFTPEQHVHSTHDFCDIVDNAKPENPCIEKFKINYVDLSVIMYSLPFNLSCNTYSDYFSISNKPKPDINRNILYSSFLI